MSKLDAPTGYEWYRLQIAGHHHETTTLVKKANDKDVPNIGILKDIATGHLLKPVQTGVRGASELCLYNTVFAMDGRVVDNDETLSQLASFMPSYYGSQALPIADSMCLFLQLDDIAARFIQPSIIDIKIGAQTYDPIASADKIAIERRKYPSAIELGFRFLGMMVHQQHTVIARDKHWGKTVLPEHVNNAIAEYLSGTSHPLAVVDEFLQRLRSIANWFERQRRFHFYSSSLLLIYESDEKRGPKIDVRMIDFSHVFNDTTLDTNYMFGITNLIKHFDSFRQTLLK